MAERIGRARDAARMRYGAGVLAALLSLGAFSCARSVAVESEPSADYAITVENRTASVLSVSFDDGAVRAELGSVEAGRTERFVVVPDNPSITVIGTSSSGRSYRRSVVLRAGETVRVVLD